MYLESIVDSTTLWFDTPILNLTWNNHFNGLRFCGFRFIECVKILNVRFFSEKFEKVWAILYDVIPRIFNNFYDFIIYLPLFMIRYRIIQLTVRNSITGDDSTSRNHCYQAGQYFSIEKMLNARYFCYEWFTGDLNDSECTSPWYQLQSLFAPSMLLEALGLG